MYVSDVCLHVQVWCNNVHTSRGGERKKDSAVSPAFRLVSLNAVRYIYLCVKLSLSFYSLKIQSVVSVILNTVGIIF